MLYFNGNFDAEMCCGSVQGWVNLDGMQCGSKFILFLEASLLKKKLQFILVDSE